LPRPTAGAANGRQFGGRYRGGSLAMARMVQCVKLQRELEGLDKPPFPGELGKRIYEQVSKEAWKLWTGHMTMLVNESRLSMSNPDAQKFLQEQVEQFFFGEGAALPPEYTPPQSK
jgi:Fe-S cluster biosynthesis and repair protein YggX